MHWASHWATRSRRSGGWTPRYTRAPRNSSGALASESRSPLKVAAFLKDEEEVGEWIAQLLEDPDLRPPHLRPRAVMSYSKLTAGEHDRISARRYTCVTGDDYTWYQASIGVRVPACKFCGKELVPA